MLKEILTKQQAKDRSLTRYYTGLPCVQGHDSERYTRNSQCIQCAKARLKKYTKTEKGKSAQSQRSKKWYDEGGGREFFQKTRVRRILGYVPEDFNSRPTVCPLCNTDDHPIVLDHSHLTNRFRGWICRECNSALGHARDSIQILENLIQYLRNNEALPVEQPRGVDCGSEVLGYG